MPIRTSLVTLERADASALDPATGSFPMTLATDGVEVSDGDVLSIEGAVYPERVPLQISHVNDPRSTAGSVTGFRRDLTSRPKRLRAHGQIELGGEGPLAEIRRDLALMVSKGHVTGISVRWEPLASRLRSALPRTHFAYVPPNDPNPMRRSGVFHERWRVLEGSVVAVQADREAAVGRAAETEGAVSAFWRAMADAASEPAPDPTAIALAELEARLAELEGAVDSLSRAEESPAVPPRPFNLAVEFEAMAARTVSDLDAYVAWSRGVVLDPPQREAAARMREKLEAIRRARRLRLPAA